jgi:general secretion pathway protein N
MKQAVGYVLLGVTAFIVFTVMLFPADRAYSLAQDKLSGATLYEVGGTVWNGKAAGAKLNGTTLRTVSWQAKPWTVVLGRVDVGWSFDNGDAWGSGIAGLAMDGSLIFRDVDAQAPADQVQPLLPRIPAQLGGVFSVDLERLELAPDTPRIPKASGEVVWTNASITVVNPAALGDFTFTLETGDDDAVNGLLKDNEGPLEAEGYLVIKPDDQYEFSATLAARDPARNDLIQGLRFLGRPDRDGKVKVKYTGSL